MKAHLVGLVTVWRNAQSGDSFLSWNMVRISIHYYVYGSGRFLQKNVYIPLKPIPTDFAFGVTGLVGKGIRVSINAEDTEATHEGCSCGLVYLSTLYQLLKKCYFLFRGQQRPHGREPALL